MFVIICYHRVHHSLLSFILVQMPEQRTSLLEQGVLVADNYIQVALDMHERLKILTLEQVRASFMFFSFLFLFFFFLGFSRFFFCLCELFCC